MLSPSSSREPRVFLAHRVLSLNDADLKAIYAYLRTVPAIANRVPELACNSGLSIVDVSDRSHPRLAGSCAPPGYFGLVAAVHVIGHYAYVAIDRDMSIDLGIIDVTDPTRPVFVANLTDPAAFWMMGLQEVGDYLLGADSTLLLKVYERGGPTNFVLAATFPTRAPVNAITVAGNCAYVSEGSAGAQVVDISTSRVWEKRFITCLSTD